MTQLILLATFVFGLSLVGADDVGPYPGQVHPAYYGKPQYPNPQRPYPGEDEIERFMPKPKSFVDSIDSKLNEFASKPNSAASETHPNKQAKMYNYYTETGPYQVQSSDPSIRQYRSDKLETTHYREDPVPPVHAYYPNQPYPYYPYPQGPHPALPYPYYPNAPYYAPPPFQKPPTYKIQQSGYQRPVISQYYDPRNSVFPPQQRTEYRQRPQQSDEMSMFPVNPHMLPPPHVNSPLPYPYPYPYPPYTYPSDYPGFPKPKFFLNSM